MQNCTSALTNMLNRNSNSFASKTRSLKSLLNGWHREPVMDITEFEDVPLH